MEDRYERILKYFEYSHLPEHLQEHSKMFHDLAHEACDKAKSSCQISEMFVFLRKLLEAKDCYVRAQL